MADDLDTAAGVRDYLQGVSTASKARAAMVQASGSNGDLEAELRAVSARTGVPISSARAMPDEVRRRDLAAQDFDGMAQRFPATMGFLADTENARIAHDDVGNLTGIETLMRETAWAARAVAGGGVSIWPGAYGVGQAALETVAPLLDPLAGTILPENPLRRAAAGFADLRRQSAALAEQVAGPLPADAGMLRQGVRSGLMSVGQQAPALVASAMTGNPAYSLTAAGALTGGTSYGKARDVGVSPLQSVIYGASDAAVEVGTEMLPVTRLLGDLKVGSGLLKTLTHQVITEVPGEQVATVLQDFDEWATLHPERTLNDYLRERPGAAAQTLIATLVGVGVQTGAVHGMASAARAIDRSAASEGDAKTLADLMALAGRSKLAERDPAAFADLVDATARGAGAPAEVYLDARQIADALQQSGISLDQVAAALPSLAGQLQDALDSNGDVVLPLGEFAAGVAGSPLGQVLMQHARTAPDALSAAEAKKTSAADTLRAAAERAAADVQTQQADTTSRDAVRATILAELQAAGRFTDDVNQAYADLTARFFEQTGRRVGMLAEQLYARYPLKVRAGTTAGESLQQADTTSEAFRNWFGDSKVVDAEGNPLVVYHGTAADFGAFDRAFASNKIAAGAGFFFTPKADLASQYAGTKGDGANVVPAFLLIRNPRAIGMDEFNSIQGAKASERLRASLEAAGNDGLQVKMADGSSMWMALEPEQIKSAIGNRGTFDPNDPSILNQSPQQRQNDQVRGTFSPATNTIALLARADLSTYLHESGHFYLEVLADLASQPDAPAEIVEDMGKVLEWFGITDELAGEKGKPKTVVRTALQVWQGMTLEQQREHHEKFARGFEAYLFEGKAPSTALARIFDRFKSWMTAVYKSIKNLGVELNPDVRGVFDRLLASQEEITRAEQARELSPLFESAAEGGMTDAEWKAYQALATAATGEAVDQLQARSLRDMRWLSNARGALLRKLQRQAEDQRRAVREEVTTEVDAMPLERARVALRKLAETDPDTKAAIKAWEKQRAEQFDAQRAAVKAEYLALQPDLKGLAKGQYLAKQKRAMDNEAERRVLDWERQNPRPAKPRSKVDMDVVAEAHGFATGEDLAKALAESPSRADMIDAMTDQRMLERYGDMADQQSIERAVDQALHNDSRARFVATELSALDKMIGKPRVLMAAAKQFATDLIARKRVAEVRVGQFTAAEVRASSEAASAKDAAARADAKRAQLMNHYAAREAASTLDEIDKGVAYLRKFAKDSVRAGLAPEYTDQIDALLERYDLRASTTQKDIKRRQSLAEWVTAQNELGIEPDIPPELLRELDMRSYKELTVAEFRGLVDTVRQIEHLGRLKNKLLTAKDQREFDAAKQSILDSIEANSRGRVATDVRTANTLTGQALQQLKAFGAAHLKAANIARILDGGKDGGPMWEYLIRTANEAGDRETTMRADATQALAALVKPLLATGPLNDGKGRTFPGFKTPLNREGRIAVALNWGNEGNRQRLLAGEGVTMEQATAVLRTLTSAEWQFVQSVWDHFETYRPEIAAKERRVYGREPDWVEPAPVQTTAADGVDVNLRGGYYPIKYDPRASERAEAHGEAEEAKALMRAAYTSATTRRSFTKSRAEEVTGRPLLYSFDGIYGGVQEVIHDLTWHEWLIDANRLVRDKGVASAIRTTYGPEWHQQLKTWLQDVAVGQKPARDAGEAALSWLRQSVSVTGLGLNVLNAAMQPLGITQSIARIGPQWVGRGLAKAVGSPFATAREISEMSPFMQDRFQTQFRELNEIRNQVKGQTRVRRAVDASMYALMLHTQRLVDVPTWWGAYEKALASGQGEQRAIDLADQAVIDSQGSGMVKDLSAIERGGPGLKLLTTFYSFFNTTLNLGVDATMTEQNKAKRVAEYLLIFTIPAVLGTLLKDALTPGDAGDDDPEKLAKKLAAAQLSFLMGTMIGVRELGGVANMVSDSPIFDYSGPGGLKVIGDATKVAQQIKQGEADDALRKAVVSLAGDLLRLPSAQINRTITGAEALADGKTDNPGALLTGYQEPK